MKRRLWPPLKTSESPQVPGAVPPLVSQVSVTTQWTPHATTSLAGEPHEGWWAAFCPGWGALTARGASALCEPPPVSSDDRLCALWPCGSCQENDGKNHLTPLQIKCEVHRVLHSVTKQLISSLCPKKSDGFYFCLLYHQLKAYTIQTLLWTSTGDQKK